MSSVAILGCGPAGLLAAHAATICGHSVTIYSNKQKSPMEGAQYMHVEIPDLDVPAPSMINYALIGTIDGYREKVYGSGDPDIRVSPEQYLGSHKCWDLRHTYDILWDRWQSRIKDMTINPERVGQISFKNEHVISTVPAPVLCYQEGVHGFDYVPVWIDNTWSGPLPAEAPSMWANGDNWVICNGADDGWYRTSHIYGHMNTEWASESAVPAGRLKPPSHVWRVRKPIKTDCTCWPMVARAGRYGLWQKGVLTHDAFDMAMQVLT